MQIVDSFRSPRRILSDFRNSSAVPGGGDKAVIRLDSDFVKASAEPAQFGRKIEALN
ncbi:hypothetical protein PAXRUDRAFT_826212 [Paxillus rubicundulus Ve08.2h10]|uniref:Uncharacterized protein n=1 Tax=Paxillus rubicundulus Ve08.2h10 TaxID=930991 RepID=A0A0D0DS84_9AGAM|nr:hypothetical protein PAXRUDRAFT_826212 [Paxillus rubicundulus Ve08.2h10]